MVLRVACIGDVDFVSGFGLAGVSYLYIHQDRDETLKKLRELVENPEIGLVILPHKIAQELKHELKELRRKRPIPLILSVPDKTGWRPKVDELRELIRRTVGAEVVLRREG